MSTTLVWFRTDLRIHDHEPLVEAHQSGSAVIPLYCFDPFQFGTTSFGFPKTGSFRARFLLDSVEALRSSLQALGSNLVIRHGDPVTVIRDLALTYHCSKVVFHTEVGTEEQDLEARLTQTLGSMRIPCQGFWGHTLFDPEDLPFEIKRIPDVFTKFRKKVEASCHPLAMLSTPPEMPKLPEGLDPGSLPTLPELGLKDPVSDERAQLHFKGGEPAGQDRVQHYIWAQDRLKVYKETRNGMLDPDDSSKFSPWLALGCLSPRYVYEQVQQYEEQRIRNDSTYWLIFELLWRDYFRFIMARYGRKVFRLSGLQGIRIPWKQDWERFELWRQGQTGFPLVDANMQELAATGFMSNRGRQNVGSFLTKNLGINWQMGAEWFESLLIDYDVCSNWGNWNYTAGVGNDARGFRYFNIPKQSRDYDPTGNYLRHWLPALARIPGDVIHEPYRLTQQDQARYDCRLGVDYPKPVVDLFKSVKANERLYTEAVGS